MQQKNIHWFPGHMLKALREIKERLKIVDLVIEVIDSRAPISSKNPFLNEIIKDKKKMIVLTKKDLCDEKKINSFLSYYEKENYRTILANLNDAIDIKRITGLANELGKERQEKYIKRGMKPQPLRVMIIGIPNVGKSTLINRLVKKSAASARNTPGHTKAQQWIRVNKDFELLDTPGILSPHYEDKKVAMNLALIGSIKDEILPIDEIYSHLIDFLILNYLAEFKARYKLNLEEYQEDKITQEIGKNRGLLLKGGEVDADSVKKLIIKEFRAGLIAKVVVDEDVGL